MCRSIDMLKVCCVAWLVAGCAVATTSWASEDKSTVTYYLVKCDTPVEELSIEPIRGAALYRVLGTDLNSLDEESHTFVYLNVKTTDTGRTSGELPVLAAVVDAPMTFRVAMETPLELLASTRHKFHLENRTDLAPDQPGGPASGVGRVVRILWRGDVDFDETTDIPVGGSHTKSSSWAGTGASRRIEARVHTVHDRYIGSITRTMKSDNWPNPSSITKNAYLRAKRSGNTVWVYDCYLKIVGTNVVWCGDPVGSVPATEW